MATAAAHTPPSPLRVLLVEDHARMRAIVASRLASELGATVEAVADIAAAVDVLGRDGFDTVLMDVNIAGESAIVRLPQVRAIAPSARIVLMSAEVAPSVQAAALAAGADKFIAKSAGLDVICEAVLHRSGER